MSKKRSSSNRKRQKPLFKQKGKNFPKIKYENNPGYNDPDMINMQLASQQYLKQEMNKYPDDFEQAMKESSKKFNIAVQNNEINEFQIVKYYKKVEACIWALDKDYNDKGKIQLIESAIVFMKEFKAYVNEDNIPSRRVFYSFIYIISPVITHCPLMMCLLEIYDDYLNDKPLNLDQKEDLIITLFDKEIDSLNDLIKEIKSGIKILN